MASTYISPDMMDLQRTKKALHCARLARLCPQPFKTPRRVPLSLFENGLFIDPHTFIAPNISWATVRERLGV